MPNLYFSKVAFYLKSSSNGLFLHQASKLLGFRVLRGWERNPYPWAEGPAKLVIYITSLFLVAFHSENRINSINTYQSV